MRPSKVDYSVAADKLEPSLLSVCVRVCVFVSIRVSFLQGDRGVAVVLITL